MKLFRLFYIFFSVTRLVLGNEYRINNTAGLIEFSKAVNSGETFCGTTVLLDSDLVFSKEDMEQFEPIGLEFISLFTGIFDGQGHTVSNFKLNYPMRTLGFFGYSENMTLKNVVIDASCYVESNFSSDKANIYINIGGVLGGFLANRGPCILENIVNMADITYSGSVIGDQGSVAFGGIVGNISPGNYYGIIKNCANYGTIIFSGKCLYASVGGISGSYFSADASLSTDKICIIQNCFNAGKLVTKESAEKMTIIGGIIGTSINNDIKNCVNYGTAHLRSETAALGAVIGAFANRLEISNCYWLNTTGFTNLYGFSYLAIPSISNSYPIDPGTKTDILGILNNWATENEEGKWMTLYTNAGTIGGTSTDELFALKRALPDPRKEGHSFAGWCTSQNCTDGIYEGKDFENVTELHAQWTINSYTIFFDFRNGSIAEEPYIFNETVIYPKGNFVWDTHIEYMPGRNVTIKIVSAINKKDSKTTTWLIIGCISGAAALVAVICASVLMAKKVNNNNIKKYDRVLDMRRSEYRFIETGISFQFVSETDTKSSFDDHTITYPEKYKVPTVFEALVEAGLDKNRADQVVNRCTSISEDLELSGMLQDNFTKDDAIAVAVYTFDFGPEMAEINPYRIINKVLVENSKEELQKVRDLLFIILSALRKLPRVEGKTLYRGMKETVNKNSYKKGKIITWAGFSSTSPDMKVTKEFLSKNASGTLFVIENGWGYDIQPYSMFPDEEEILLEPGQRFEIKGVIESDVVIINLRMLDKVLPLL